MCARRYQRNLYRAVLAGGAGGLHVAGHAGEVCPSGPEHAKVENALKLQKTTSSTECAEYRIVRRVVWISAWNNVPHTTGRNIEGNITGGPHLIMVLVSASW